MFSQRSNSKPAAREGELGLNPALVLPGHPTAFPEGSRDKPAQGCDKQDEQGEAVKPRWALMR